MKKAPIEIKNATNSRLLAIFLPKSGVFYNFLTRSMSCAKLSKIILLALLFSACSQQPAENKALELDVKSDPKVKAEDTVLQGYKDKVQDAKDMEKEILKQAENKKRP